MAKTDEIKILVEAEVDKALKDFKKLQKSGEKSTGRLKKGFSTAGKVVAGFGIALAVGGVAALKKFSDAGAKLEQTMVAFNTLFGGNTVKAKAFVKELQALSAVTPFTSSQVLEAGKALLAFGINADKVQGNLKQIGDISAGTGKDFNELAVIFGKARTQGTLFAEDINQLTEAGIPIIDEFAKELGVSASEVKKLGSQGQITFPLLEKGFQNLTSEGGRFFNLTSEQSKTFAGRISTLKSNLEILAATVGTKINKAFGKYIDQLIDLSKNSKIIDGVIKGAAIGAAVLSGAIKIVINFVTSLAKIVQGAFLIITGGFENAVNNSETFAKAIQGIGKVFGIITKVAEKFFETLRKEAEEAPKELTKVKEGLKLIAEGYSDIVLNTRDVITDTAKEITDAFDDVAEKSSQTTTKIVEDNKKKNEAIIEQEKLTSEELQALLEQAELTREELQEKVIMDNIMKNAAIIDNEKLTNEQRVAAAEKLAKDILIIEQSKLVKMFKANQKYVSQVQQINAMLSDVSAQYAKTETAITEKKVKEGVLTEQQGARKVAEIRRKEAIIQKATAITETAINTAVAAVKAVATLGPVAGGIAAGFITALGATKIALIAREPLPEVPAFAQGGITPGGTVMVGERGPELVNLPQGSNVINNNETNEILNQPQLVIENVNMSGVNDPDAFIQQLNDVYEDTGIPFLGTR